ncbi:MAG: hypothetical protein IH944_13090 [Armatimonadetes bacterium]|nr:hypothetical protein [Armatimonadota bacterium]
MRIHGTIGLLTLGLAGVTAIVGCGEKAPPEPTVPMGAAAPEFGSTEALSSISGFIDGRWSPAYELDTAFAELFGLDVLQMDEVDTSQYWQFKSDGTFFYGKPGLPSTVEGTWKVVADAVRLTYVSFNGKPLAEVREELQKGAEKGTQAGIARELALNGAFDYLLPLDYLILAEDNKRLMFANATTGAPGLFSFVLERLAVAE